MEKSDERPDEQLVDEYIRGGPQSFLALELLIKRYSAHIYRFVYRTLGNRTTVSVDAQDITQEVFLKMWKNIRRFDSKYTFKTWLYTIAERSTIDMLRKRTPALFSELDREDESGAQAGSFSESIPDPSEGVESLYAQAEKSVLDKKKVDEMLDTLSPEQRSVILLHDAEDLTFEEIALILKKPMNTVKSQYRRGIQSIRSRFAPDTLHAPK